MTTSPVTIGETVGRYCLERELGRGATSIVYLGRDVSDAAPVAIKVLRPELMSSISADRFLREVRLAATLRHTSIVPILDSGDANGRLFCVMPHMDGGTLRERLRREKQLAIPDVTAIGITVSRALHFAHEQNIIHRDVKPENILFSGGQAALSDFGIARALIRATDEGTTSTGIVRGTPAYMSPEQAAGDQDIDGRSDIFSLACVLYEALAGVPAFIGPTSASVVAQRFSHSPRPVRVFRPTVPDELERVLAKALAIAPPDRYRSANEFADALAAAGSSNPNEKRTIASAVRRLKRIPRRRYVQSVAALLITAALATAGAVVTRQRASSVAGPARDPDLDPRHIAVLYFDDHSPDKSLDYLASGLTESLIHELSAVPALRVISRNGVKPFRDVAIPTDNIARKLRVGSLVEGSVQRSNDRIRLTVQLIDAASGTHRNSSTLERKMDELFLLEDELAQRVAALLRRSIGTEVLLRERATATRNAVARQLVWQADRLRDEADTIATSRYATDVRRALGLSQRADSLLAAAERADPKWIGPVVDRGWVAYETARRQSGSARNAAFDSSIAHANRALNRDSANAAALELRGSALYFRSERGTVDDRLVAQDLAQANADLEGAIRQDSTRASAWGTLSRVRRALGDMADAERKAVTALAMDAYLADASSIIQTLFGANLMNDSLDAAWRWCRRGGTDFPREVRFVTCQMTLLAEDWSRAPDPRLAERLLAESVRLDPPERAGARGQPWLPIYREMMLAVVLARNGAKDSARAIAARAQARVGNDPVMRVDLEYEQALLEVALGNRKSAFALLGDYLHARPYLRDLVSRHPRWKPISAEPEFQDLLTGPPPDTPKKAPRRSPPSNGGL